MAEAGELIRAGKVVVYPTETLYGLGADAKSVSAVQEVCVMKGRAPGKPISVIVADRNMLDEIVEKVGGMAELLMKAFWPGPLTIVFDAAGCLPRDLTANTGSIGARIPDSEVALDLLRAAERPLTATSANRSGEDVPSSPHDIPAGLAKEPAMVIDAGVLPPSEPSTVVDARGPKVSILRQGAIPRDKIMEVINQAGGL